MSNFPEVEKRFEEVFRSPLAVSMLKQAIERGDASGMAEWTMTYLVEHDGTETAFEASEALHPHSSHEILLLNKLVNGKWVADQQPGIVQSFFGLVQMDQKYHDMYWAKIPNLARGLGSTAQEAYDDLVTTVLNMLNVKGAKGSDVRWLESAKLQDVTKANGS